MYQQLGYFFSLSKFEELLFSEELGKDCFLQRFIFPFPKNIQSVFQRKYLFNCFCDRRRTCDAKHIETVFARVEKKRRSNPLLSLAQELSTLWSGFSVK